MHILRDAGADLTAEQVEGLTIHRVPLTFALAGQAYRSGVDIELAAFYDLLAGTKSFPTTLRQILDLKPVIGVGKTHGTYVVHARERSPKRALRKIAEILLGRFGTVQPIRTQVLHGPNPAGAAHMVSLLAQRFIAHILPTSTSAPVLGAHTGPGLVGVCAAPLAAFADIPGIA